MKLFFTLFLALPASALARIGDTEADHIQRYGQPVFQVEAIDGFPGVKGRTFRVSTITVPPTFWIRPASTNNTADPAA
jgi:hypothetical protein